MKTHDIATVQLPVMRNEMKQSLSTLNNSKNIQQSAEAFNSYVLSHFLKSMYSTSDDSDTDPAFTGGIGARIFHDFLLNEYSKVIGDKLPITNSMITKYLEKKTTANTHDVKQKSEEFNMEA